MSHLIIFCHLPRVGPSANIIIGTAGQFEVKQRPADNFFYKTGYHLGLPVRSVFHLVVRACG